MNLNFDLPVAPIAKAYVADISLVAAILESQDGDLSDLPALMLTPDLREVVAAVGEGGELSSAAVHLLHEGAGRQERSRRRVTFDQSRATDLLKMMRSDEEAGTRIDQAPERKPLKSLFEIRTGIRGLAENSSLPVMSIGAGFKQFLDNLPALIYKDALGALDSIRHKVRGATGTDTRCIWVTIFAWTAGAAANIEGLPPQDEIALMIDP